MNEAGTLLGSGVHGVWTQASECFIVSSAKGFNPAFESQQVHRQVMSSLKVI